MFAGNFTGGSHLIAAYRVLSFIYCVANNNLRYVLASACEYEFGVRVGDGSSDNKCYVGATNVNTPLFSL